MSGLDHCLLICMWLGKSAGMRRVICSIVHMDVAMTVVTGHIHFINSGGSIHNTLQQDSDIHANWTVVHS